MTRIALGIVLASALLLGSAPGTAVVNGSPATQGEYPEMVAVYASRSPQGMRCGGSLVAPTIVVTAAHCIDELIDNLLAVIPLEEVWLRLKVFAGEVDLRAPGGERIAVTRVTAHPDSDIDIAVLELAEASSYTPIRFATAADAVLYAPGTFATVTGWGATSEGGPGSDVLLEAHVPIVSDADCANSYPGGIVAEAMVCAGYEEGGTDTCQGDSGGPMTVPDGSERVLIGATSWGDGCARAGKPGVYAEVSAAADFIAGFTG